MRTVQTISQVDTPSIFVV